MNTELFKLAKESVFLAMEEELKINQDLIDNSILYRNTQRHKKIDVLTAMARNNAIQKFLNLEIRHQTPRNLKQSVPMSADYKELMHKISATSYGRDIKIAAERNLYSDYTHVNYLGRVFLLDVPVTSKDPKFFDFFSKIMSAVVYIGIFCLFFGWIPVAIWSSWGDGNSSTNGESNNIHTAGSVNTFSEGGINNGKADSKSVGDDSQVKDDTKQTELDNNGQSGYDSNNSIDADNESETNRDNISKNTTLLRLDHRYKTVAEYFLPDSDSLSPYLIIPSGKSVSVNEGSTVIMDFLLPINSGAVYRLNGNVIEGRSVSSEIYFTWFKFVAEKGDNNVTVDYNGVSYIYYFPTFRNTQ